MRSTSLRRFWSWFFLSLLITGDLSALYTSFSRPPKGGPGTPEVQSFTPAGIENLVDPFTGDFSYNIPLLTVGDYPVNLSYQSAVTPDEEAGWVGLGWSLHPGSINRNVKGLPDDFKGDAISKKQHLKPRRSVGASMAVSGELAGAEFLENISIAAGQNVGFEFNNYTGWDYTVGSTSGISASLNPNEPSMSGSLSLSSGYSRSSGNYLRPGAGLGIQAKTGEVKNTFGVQLGLSANAREGLKKANFGFSYKLGWTRTGLKKEKLGAGSVYKAKVSFPLYSGYSFYTPAFDMPRVNTSGTFSLNTGGEISYVSLSGKQSGYFATERLEKSLLSKPAFGYLYAHLSAEDDGALQDINREKDGPFQEKMPHLPVPHFTHDVFMVTGQGFQGQFRPFRSDIGILSDPKVTSKGFGATAGIDASFGNLVKAGTDVAGIKNDGVSGPWKADNDMRSIFRFAGRDSADALYEPVYFKQVGELTALHNPGLFDALGGYRPFHVRVKQDGVQPGRATTQIQVAGERNYRDISGLDTQTSDRPARKELLTWRTASEAMQSGLNKLLPVTNAGITLVSDIPPTYDIAPIYLSRDADFRQPHHISEMTLTKSDGMRYVYGLPAYNVTQKEVSFNASGLEPTQDRITYTPGVDDGPGNERGKDHMYSRIETPAYAYAYHLTALLSTDYVDVSGNGPTPDDLGSYTRFHYSRPYERFKWRMPFGLHEASFDAGYDSDLTDDRAHYTYGEKEIYYVKAIETKNYIAEFYTSPRTDGQEAAGIHGGAGTRNLHRLDSIRLFSRPDVVANGPNEAVPLQTVYFEYDYSLCSGAPGAETGKLTLRSVSFAYRSSNQHRYSPYAFTYGHDPDYQPGAADRWGTFKSPHPGLANSLFPFTAKNKAQADSDAGAWLLTNIKTPTNSQITVNYEADDYAYVQDRRAMDLLSVAGFSATEATSPAELEDVLFTPNTPDPSNIRRYLYVRLPQAMSSDQDVAPFLSGISELYLKARVDVSEDGSGSLWEDIRCFVPVEPEVSVNYGLTDFDPTLAWIRLPTFARDGKDKPDDTGSYHPITKAAAQQLVKTNPLLAYGLTETGSDDILTFFRQVTLNQFGFLGNVLSFQTFLREFTGANRANQVDTSRTWVRLNNGAGTKWGGGSRVQSILINDQWDEQSGVADSDFTYGYTYRYRMSMGSGSEEREISSGVASWEPLIGKEENPFVEPARYHIDKKLATDINAFSILPVNESYIPAPVVGYRRVEVVHLREPTISERSATGKTVHEFFTAYDFPVRVSLTKLQQKLQKPRPNPFVHRNLAVTAQGYSIELNNMHGKPKARLLFSQQNDLTPVAGQRFVYRTDPNNRKRLSNRALAYDPASGAIDTATIGVAYEVILDARSSQQTGTQAGAAFNLDIVLNGPIPAFTPSAYPLFSYTELNYRSIVTNKIIMRSGLLDRVENFDNGAALATANLVYDARTGEVLVTGKENVYGALVYSTQLPAHYVYPGMGPAWQNAGVFLDSVAIVDGALSHPQADALFQPGDELLLTFNAVADGLTVAPPIPDPPTRPREGLRAWVLDVEAGTARIIDERGEQLNLSDMAVRVVRSGYRNQLGATAQTVQSLSNPVSPDGPPGFQFTAVLDAQAQTFSNHWQSYLGFHTAIPESKCECQENVRNQVPVTEGVLQFLAQEVLGYDPGPGPKPIGIGALFLPDDFNPGHTIFHRSDRGPSLDIQITDTLTNNTCSIRISTLDGSPVPSLIDTLGIDPEWTDFADFGCDGARSFRTRVLDFGQAQREVPLQISSDCLDFLQCTAIYETEFPEAVCGITPGQLINPFTTGIYGNWHPKANYRYMVNRHQEGQLAQQGVYLDFYPFFPTQAEGLTLPGMLTLGPDPNGSETGFWQQLSERELMDPYGKSLQTRNALDIPSATLYGFGFSLPMATARRAQHHQIAFDSFEDYDYTNVAESPFQSCTLPAHWRFPEEVGVVEPTATAALDPEQVHSGRFSLRLEGDVFVERVLFEACDPDERTLPGGTKYELQVCDLIPPFSPTGGQYLVSAWVKDWPGSPVLDTLFEKSSIKIAVQTDSSTLVESFFAAGPIVDGWQQINGVFTLPENGLQQLTLTLANPTGDGWVSFWDDIRIQPFHAQMQTYVYDHLSMQLTCVLDERNFGTFYEYDDEGRLVRTEKETEQGRLTLEEIRSVKPKNTKTPISYE